GAAMAILQVAVLAAPLVFLYDVLQWLVRLAIDSVDRGLRPYTVIAAEVAVGVLMLVGYRIGVPLFGSRPGAEAVVRTGAALALFGTLIGTGLFCLMYAVFWAMGFATFAGVRGFDGLPRELGLAIASGISEEVTVRGAVFRPLEGAFGTLPALILSS